MEMWLSYHRLGCAMTVAGMLLGVAHSTAIAQSGATDPPEKFWTPSRIRSAQPMEASPGPDFAPQPLPETAPSTQGQVSPVTPGSPAAPPTIAIPPGWSKRLAPPEDLRGEVESEAVPGALLLGYYFTTSRVFPPPEGDPPDAAITFPYGAAGRFFFSDPRTGGLGSCSASLIGPTLIVTAAHCVANASTVASGRYYFTNFMFVPAWTNGSAPFNAWSGISPPAVDNSWFNSNYSATNAIHPADYALVRLMPINGIQPGAVIGFYGWATNALVNQDITQLGYPGNLDSGNLMEVNHSKVQKNGTRNTYIIGSAMGGGASGGPWIVDFGVQPAGAPPVGVGGNVVVAVYSYGPKGTVGYSGASQFDTRFVNLLHGICGSPTATNC